MSAAPRSLLIAAMVLFLGASSVSAQAVFQYHATVTTNRNRPSDAFLWLPPASKAIRGVIVAGMTSVEREMVKDPHIRAACSDEHLAILFFKAGLESVDVQATLDEMARKSGYRELSVAPLLFIGHSAGGPKAKNSALQFVDRCFGLIQSRGGGPWHGINSDPPLVPIPAHVPCLMLVGQFDEFGGLMRDEQGREPAWENARDALIAHRTAHPQSLLSMVIEPGGSHFAGSERNAKFAAMFIRKAAVQIPTHWPIDAKTPPKLARFEAASGWLSDLRLLADSPARTAAWADYSGEKAAASWHFDREMAEAADAYHKGLRRKDQFIRWKDRTWVDAGARFYFHEIRWVVDGQTFEVQPEYAPVYPGQYNGHGPRWPKAGEEVGNSGTPIRVRRIMGPLEPVAPNRLRIQYDGLTPATESMRTTFLAYSEGNDEYRHTEHMGMLPRGFAGIMAGKDQTITFDALKDMKASDSTRKLEATSDGGLPVEYYIAYGPAMIEGNTLKITHLPARAAYPIEVKVVAWQFGRGTDPKIRTAKPVEQAFSITGP